MHAFCLSACSFGRISSFPLTCILSRTANTHSGMGINPTPQSALSVWGPYVFTLLFLTFGMRGLEPLKRFLYDRQKRRKQVRGGAAIWLACLHA